MSTVQTDGVQTSEERTDERAGAVRALEGEFSALITQLRRIVTEIATRVSPGMLPGAYRVFTTIARGEHVTISALADDLGADKGQISRTVRELEDLGLIARTPDPDDGRSVLLAPTPEGTARLAAARSPQQNLLQDALSDWPVDDIHTLTRLLHALTTAERA